MSNPAKRLSDILTAGQGVNVKTQSMHAWRNILNVKGDDNYLLTSIGKVMALPQEIEHSLSLIDDIDLAMYMDWKPSVNAAFMNSSIVAPWEAFIKHINKHTINYLKFTSNFLDEKYKTVEIECDNIDAIISKISELINDIVISDLDREIKRFIFRKLEALKTSLVEYKICGAEPIDDYMNGIIAYVCANKVEIKRSFSGEVWDKFCTVVNLVAAAITISAYAWSPVSALDTGSNSSERLPDSPPAIIQVCEMADSGSVDS